VLKQQTSRKLKPRGEPHFWQRRYYDFNVRNPAKTVEKLRYMHRNPVLRGLAAKPEDWPWSSFRHYATGVPGTVEIESEWTARRRTDVDRCGAGCSGPHACNVQIRKPDLGMGSGWRDRIESRRQAGWGSWPPTLRQKKAKDGAPADQSRIKGGPPAPREPPTCVAVRAHPKINCRSLAPKSAQ
jgi:hypothetical protein